jgi:hypothetical protein
MLASHTRELINRVRSGQFELADVADIEQLSARAFIQELNESYPIVFQERSVKSKLEIGLARSVKYELAFSRRSNSVFPVVRICTVLRGCLLLSCYDDGLSELTAFASIRASAMRHPVHGLALKTSRGFKLDRTPDGWQLKSLEPKSVKLTEEVLGNRGWRFDVLSPIGGKP